MLLRSFGLFMAAAALALPAPRPIAPGIRTPSPQLAFGQAPGQSDTWIAQGAKYSLAVAGTVATARLGDETLRLQFVGAKASAPAVPADVQPGRVNYLIGSDPKSWAKDTPTYARLTYRAVYPNTDVVWYGNEGSLEYDLLLGPGADPNAIRLHLDGARQVSLVSDGIRIDMSHGSLDLRAPVVYQEAGGLRHNVPCRYELAKNGDVGFHLDHYDASRPVVIDPVLVYASYFGYSYSSGKVNIGTDSAGNLYLGGVTAYVPVTADAQPGFAGTRSIAVSKFDQAGTLQYSTYVGGDENDALDSMAVGSDGTVVLSGHTSNISGFPFTETAPSNPGYSEQTATFLMKLNAAGNGFVFVAHAQGFEAAFNDPSSVSSDASGNSYLGGSGAVMSTTSGAYNDGPTSAYIAKYSPTGALLYLASLPNGASIEAVTADNTGKVYLAGQFSTNLSNVPSFPGSLAGTSINVSQSSGSEYLFACQLSADGSQLGWASFVGAPADSSAARDIAAISLDSSSGSLYVSGNTYDATLPTTPGAWETASGAGVHGFLFAVSNDGNSFPALTYLNGMSPGGMTVTSNGVVVTGTGSQNLPAVSAIQPDPPGSQASLFKSSDAGGSWAPLPAAPAYGTAMWIDPQNSSVLLDFTGGSLYRSADAGVTWSPVTSVGYTSIGGFTTSPDSNTLYLASFGSVYASTDAGNTWNALPYNFFGAAGSLSVNPQNPRDIVAVVNGTGYRSLDGGVTFSIANSSGYATTRARSPLSTFTDANGNILIAGYQNCSRSIDRGQTWQLSDAGFEYIAATAQAPSSLSTVYAVDYDRGLFKTTDLGATWTQVNSHLAIYGIAVSPADPNTIYLSDYYGNLFTSTDGGVTLNPVGAGPDTASVAGLAVDFSTPAKFYVLSNTASSSFVTKLNSSLTSAIWSTYYGSSQGTTLTSAAAVPGSSDVWVGGYSSGYVPATGSETSGSGAVIARISDATPACTFTLNPQGQYVYQTNTIFAALAAPSGCSWTATTDASWITLKHGSSGTGSGTITAQALGNTTGTTRVGHISAAGQTITVTEPGSACSFTIPSSISAPFGGGSVQVPVVTAPGCVWDAETDGAVTVTSPGTGSGTGIVTVNVPAPGVAAANTDYIQVAGQTISVQPATPSTSPALEFIPVTPCRIADTRQPDGPFGGPIIAGLTSRDFTIPSSRCGIPALVQAYSVNVTVVPSNALGYLTLYPTGNPLPLVSTLNSVDGRVKAAAAIVGAGANGAVSVFASNDTHVVLDINGYFITPGGATGTPLAFYPLTPCRVADTRNAKFGALGTTPLSGGQARELQIGATECNIPAGAQAYSMNFTAVPKGKLGYLTVWPSGQSQPTVSTLNATTGQVTANAAIVPAGAKGDVSVFASNDTDLVIDVNGYFAAPGTGGLSLYTVTPCRVFDSRKAPGSLLATATNINLAATACGAPTSAQAFVTNATVVPSGGLGFLTLWPQAGDQPTVSTLNALDGVVTSNLAIVPATNGLISAFPSNPTHLLMDLSGYFQ